MYHDQSPDRCRANSTAHSFFATRSLLVNQPVVTLLNRVCVSPKDNKHTPGLREAAMLFVFFPLEGVYIDKALAAR